MVRAHVAFQALRAAEGLHGERSAPTLLTRCWPKASWTVSTWSTISAGDRPRAKPPAPVAQKEHRMGQPTCACSSAKLSYIVRASDEWIHQTLTALACSVRALR